MNTLVRTTITIPEDIYSQAKVVAAAKNESLGTLSLGIKSKMGREEIYAGRFERKVGRRFKYYNLCIG